MKCLGVKPRGILLISPVNFPNLVTPVVGTGVDAVLGYVAWNYFTKPVVSSVSQVGSEETPEIAGVRFSSPPPPCRYTQSLGRGSPRRCGPSGMSRRLHYQLVLTNRSSASEMGRCSETVAGAVADAGGTTAVAGLLLFSSVHR